MVQSQENEKGMNQCHKFATRNIHLKNYLFLNHQIGIIHKEKKAQPKFIIRQNIQIRIKPQQTSIIFLKMPKHQSFTAFLTQKHPQYVQLWTEMINSVQKNCCLKINRIGYVFWFDNLLCFLLNRKTFIGFDFLSVTPIVRYFLRFQQYCNFLKANDPTDAILIDFFEHFISSNSRSLSGYQVSVALDIHPLGKIIFEGKTIEYNHQSIIWTLNQNKSNVQRLPPLIKPDHQASENHHQRLILHKMARKFSLSLKKQQPQKFNEALKRTVSLRKLAQEPERDQLNTDKTKNNIKRLSLNIHPITKHQRNQISQNRILRLKSQVSQKINHHNLSSNKLHKKISRKQAHKSLFNKSIRLQDKNYQLPITKKFNKSSSQSDIKKIAQTFKQRPLKQGFTSIFQHSLSKSQSGQKLQNPKIKNRQKKQTPEKQEKQSGNSRPRQQQASMLKNKFSQKINENPKKLKLQLRKDTIKKDNIFLKSIKIQQQQFNAEYKKYPMRNQVLHTEPHQPNQCQIFSDKKDQYHLGRNFHFTTLNAQDRDMFDKAQENQNLSNVEKRSYSNQFLRRSLSKPRLGLQQVTPKINLDQLPPKLIICQRSPDLLEKVHKQFPSQSKSIDEMIQEFQIIWKSSHQHLLKQIEESKNKNNGFNQFYNQRIFRKVDIQKQKKHQLNDINQQIKKSSISVKKIVAKIQYEQNSNKNRNLSGQSSEEKIQTKISFKKFKSKCQFERLAKICSDISNAEKHIKRMVSSELKKISWSFEESLKKQKKNKEHKAYMNISTINFEETLEGISSLLKTINKTEARQQKDTQALTNKASAKQKESTQNERIQTTEIGPEIALGLRELYVTLTESFWLIGEAILANRSDMLALEIKLSIDSFFTIPQTIEKNVKVISCIFSTVEKQIAQYYPALKIEGWQKSKCQQIVNVFEQVYKKAFESEQFLEKQLFYSTKLQHVFNSRVYMLVSEMATALAPVDEVYCSKELEEPETIQVNRVMIDVTPAKNNIREKIKLCLIDVQDQYQQRLRGLCTNIDKLLRVYIEIKPEMLFEQNYLEVKKLYLNKVQEIQRVFSFVLSRRLIYLGHRSKTLIDLFKKILQKKQKVNLFLANLDSRLKVYRSEMEDEITDIQKIDKQLKQRLKQLGSKLKHLISEMKESRDILANQKQVSTLNDEFLNYNKQKNKLVKRMQQNEIIYWDDDTYFQRNVAALIFSLDFIKSEKFKLICQASVPEIDWRTFLSFQQSYTQLMTILEETKLAKIFKPNFDLFENNAQFIELVLYKNHSKGDLQKINAFEIKLGKDSHLKLVPVLKKIASMDKKLQDNLLFIFRAAKENEFYKLKRQIIIAIEVKFEEVTYFSQNLKEYKLYRIGNSRQIYEKAAVLCCEESEVFLNNVQRFNKITHELFYLKKTIIHLNAIENEEKKRIFLEHYESYDKILTLLKSPERINISQNQIYDIYKDIERQRETLGEVFYNQKVRFFPRLSLLDINSLVDCFSWNTREDILRNVQSLYKDIDDVICEKDSCKLKKLKVGHDYIDFQKDMDPDSMNSIEFLKYFYATVQAMMEDSVSESFKRICHMKIMAWYIYFTEQLEYAFLMKSSISELRGRIELHIKEIGSGIRYDIYQHHKKYEITQLNFFLDFLHKLEREENPEHSYLWTNAIKVYQKNKKVVIRQNKHQYEFGYEPKKPEPFQPQFKIERSLKYGTQQHIEQYKISATITGRPFFHLKLLQTTLKNKVYKILDIIYKYNFFVIVDYDLLFQSDQVYFQALDSAEKGKRFFQTNFQPSKMRTVKSQHNNTNRNACSLINDLYKELIYFSERKQQTDGIQEASLPVLIKYPKISAIPTNLRVGYRTIDRPSRLFSLELIVLIQLNKYQDFFSKFAVNLGRISSFFKLINEEFAMSFEKLIKILQDLDSFIKSLKRKRGDEGKSEYELESRMYEQSSGADVSMAESRVAKSNFYRESEGQLLSEESVESVESKEYDERNILLVQKVQIFGEHLAKTQKTIIQQKNELQAVSTLQTLQITKLINKELFRILVHYYPDKEVEISKIIQYLGAESLEFKEQSALISEAVQNLKQGGKNVIIYGQMSQKTTLIRQFFIYGKNLIQLINEDGNKQTVEIYYLEGLKNYLDIKQTGFKFIVEVQEIHEITPTQICQNLVYIHPLSQKQLKSRFSQSLKRIFTTSNCQQYLRQPFQNDIWTCFSDLYSIYAQCSGLLSLISKMDIFLNVLEKELFACEERNKKKTDPKIFLKQIIIIMIELYVYSLDLPQRKKFVLESKKKQYFQLNQLKAISIEDLYNFTSINLETQKIEQLIKRQRFVFKNIFPIDRQIAMVKKYFNLEKKYIECLQKAQLGQQTHVKGEKIAHQHKHRPLLRNFNFIFLTQNHIVNQTLHSYFKEEFQEDFKHFEKYLPNSKFLRKCLDESPLNVAVEQNLNPANKTFCVIEDLHLAIQQEQTLIKILLDHHTEFSKNKFYAFFTNKFYAEQNKDNKHKSKLECRPSLVFTIGEICLESVYKYLVKNNVHENTIQKAKKLLNRGGVLSDPVDYLKFILETQVKLPSQLYEKYFLKSILLFNFTSNPSLEQHEYKYGSFNQEAHQLSIKQLRTSNNFWDKLNSSIASIEETVGASYKFAVFLKKRTYLQLNEVDIQKYLDRFVQMFDEDKKSQTECFYIELDPQKSHGHSTEDKEKKSCKKKKILSEFMVKNHLKKYLHLSLNQQKVYVIEEEMALLPYLISFLHEQRLYTIIEETTFVEQFISVISSEIRLSKEKEAPAVVYENFYILIKPPLALSPLFMQILHLIQRKVSFLNFTPEFEGYVDSEKGKAEYVFNNLELCHTKIKEFYHVVFNHCKFIISIKQCHKELFYNLIPNSETLSKPSDSKLHSDDKYSITQSRKQKTKCGKRLSQRESLINRQLFQKSEKEWIKRFQAFYEHNVSSVDKLSKEFWQKIVYLNVTMREQEKVQVSKHLLAKYLDELEEEQWSLEELEKSQKERLRKNIDTNKKKLYQQLEDLLIEVLEKVLGYYNLSICAIDQMIRDTVWLLLSQKKKLESAVDMKSLSESVKISSNIIQIKNEVEAKINLLVLKTNSKQKIIQHLTRQVNNRGDPLKQPQNSWINQEIISLAQKQTNESLDYRAGLPFRKKKTSVFYFPNSKAIELQKERFYGQSIQELEDFFYEKAYFKNNPLDINLEDKATFFYKALKQSVSTPSSLDHQSLLKDSFIFLQDQLLPNQISLEFIQFLFSRKKSLKKITDHIPKQSERKKRMSIDNKTMELEKLESKRQAKIASRKTSKGKLRESNVRDSQMGKTNLKLSNSKTSLQPQEVVKEEIEHEGNEDLQENNNLTKYLFMSSMEFVESYPVWSIFDLVYQCYFSFMVELYEKYEFPTCTQQKPESTQTKQQFLQRKEEGTQKMEEDAQTKQTAQKKQQTAQKKQEDTQKQQSAQRRQEEEKLKLQKFSKQLSDAQYFLTLDLLTLENKFRQKYQRQLQVSKGQLELLDRYIEICMKFSGENSQKQHSKIISEEKPQQKSVVPPEIKSHLYETLFLNTLSNIKDNSTVNDSIKKILQIDSEPSLLSSIKKLSKNKINLSLTEQVQIKILQERCKFIIADPYHEFCNLIKSMDAECIFVDGRNFKELHKIRFKIVFYVFDIESMSEFCEKKGLIEKVEKVMEEKSLDSKSINQKLVLLVPSKKLLDGLNFSQRKYTALNLEYTYMKFSEQMNIKKEKLSREQTESLFESYTNAYSRLHEVSKQIGSYPVKEREKIMKCLEKAQHTVIKKFLNLSQQIQSIYAQKNRKSFEEGKCGIIYQYLIRLIEQEIIPYRYVKRIHQKLDWLKMEELISTYSKTIRKVQNSLKTISPGVKEEIKGWLGKQLLALRSENFLDQFKECIAVSNAIVVVYDILNHKIFKEIKLVSENQKIEFKFFFEFDKLSRKDFLINIDESGQINFHEQTKLKTLKLSKSLFKGSQTSFDNFEGQTNKAFGRNSVLKKKKHDNSIDKGEYPQKKRIYFVHQKQIYKVKDVIHICSIIWV